MKRPPEYGVWRQMRNRCSNPNNTSYPWYGGRGVSVCQEWASFERFMADMGPRPSADHSIDRIDSNGNYEPSNCRWATRAEQQHNRHDNVWLELNGRRQLIGDWAAELGVTRQAISKRLRKGWPLERALSVGGSP